jgi:hypothetical protein
MTRDVSRTDVVRGIDDPLDLHIHAIGLSRRSAWSTWSSQAAPLLLMGIALGHQGLALLTPGILEMLRPAVPVALAVLGVTAALGPADRDRWSRPGTYVLTTLVLVAGLAMTVYGRTPVDALATVGQAAVIAALLAGAGWILSSHGASAAERRVFSIATFLLLGGLADYLSVSALLLGWVAAAVWRRVRTAGLDEVRLDASYVQHPITALLMVTAGAQVQLSWPAALFAAAAVCVALVTMLILRPHGARISSTLGGVPLTPGAFAVALAMDAVRLDSRLGTLLSIVVLAAATLDFFSAHIADDAA